MLLHRYHNIDYIWQMDIDTGAALILKALEKERDDRIFQQWVAQLHTMALAGKPISYQEYKNSVTGADIDRRPTEVIEADLADVERELQHGGGDS